MLKPIILVVSVLLFAYVATAMQVPGQLKSPDIDVKCVEEHCLQLSLECLTTKACVQTIACTSECLSKWVDGSQNFGVQNCTNKCYFTYALGSMVKEYTSCLVTNKCLSFPPVPKTCKSLKKQPAKALSTKDLIGDWYVVRGYNEVYDCYPCQEFSFKMMNASETLYTANFKEYLVNGSLIDVDNVQFQLPNNPPGQSIMFTYNLFGFDETDTWWLLDKADDGSWIQLYYCGNGVPWNYEGALVFSKSRTLDSSAYKQIAQSYNDYVGIDLNNFCSPITSAGFCS